MQVMVMDPNLIPQAVNVVIGENLYELKFHVEWASDAAKPSLWTWIHFLVMGVMSPEMRGRVASISRLMEAKRRVVSLLVIQWARRPSRVQVSRWSLSSLKWLGF
jgi:hypothetical protein